MRMKREGVALSVQAVVALVQFGDPDSITFFSADQKAKAKKVNSNALQMMQWAIKHDLLMVTGGDMFGPDLPNQADKRHQVQRSGGEPGVGSQDRDFECG